MHFFYYYYYYTFKKMKSRKKSNLETSQLYFASLFKAKVPDKEDSSRQRGGHPPVG